MNLYNKLTIAIDFDGTIVEDAYPGIGKPRIFAFETLTKLQEDGHRLILWTYRHGDRLNDAVEFCKKNGVEFYAVNKSFPEEQEDNSKSRKIHADLFIDDRNLGELLGWGEIYQILTKEEVPKRKKQKKGFFDFFK
ncbi:MAG: hydrolase [Bacteroidia bacterium]|nr:hydrolase [Bacteroidia bacterium]NND26055.1 hydrolase [Flavobacteriaceae bacterium]MBT8279522.1 hydrolase [Bacteroidia bacterium]NNK61013.1 hydrolase [Flavobacteriaceae bacterium]NNL33593.1 hydrolase [Flavobacteriaceae bacterium]